MTCRAGGVQFLISLFFSLSFALFSAGRSGFSWARLWSGFELIVHRRSNQALERTATRRAFTFRMIKTVSVAAMLALDDGRSAYSR
jgi:hypothetical protein